MRYLLGVLFVCLTSCTLSNVEYLTEGNRPPVTSNLYQISFSKEGRNSTILKINPYVAREMERSIISTLAPAYMESMGQKPDFRINVRLESDWDPRVGNDRQRTLKGINGSVFPDADPRARNYQLRRITLEVVSTRVGELFWRGTASGVLNEKIDGGKSQIAGIEKLLAEFKQAAEIPY